ncbi:NUDIX HYDROLASE RELATED [Salix koriyanagi]|uniref:NUDIX HYDROLASE RELATED n=1 Tax=Salix koriyanagi TaxID=2511006 RepID=A0A9Q0T0B8_9ROSI|nr:NUDIX HYDROLASE RELATED [Salix koriyanagi]
MEISFTSSLPPMKQPKPDAEKTFQQIGLLNAVEDTYGGVKVDVEVSMDCNVYVHLLRASTTQWRKQGKKGVWIKLPIQLANLVEPTVKEGFRYHHAESDYLMLVQWIPETPDTLPANASHTVGIGAFVVNDTGEVLVVQEKNGAFKGKGVWKFPTGGEDICKAAIREVKEETDIDTEFVEILAFSQTHQGFCRKSDLFFVCMLRPLSSDINKQDSEIEAAQWMPIEEYIAQPYNQKHESFKNIAKICLSKSKRNYTGFSAVPMASSSGKKTSYSYFNKLQAENEKSS